MTKLLTQTFTPFPDAFKCGEVLKTENFDPYEKPTDVLGTHYALFNCTQKQIIIGVVKRVIRLDFYRKRLTVLGSFEGTVFDARGSTILSYGIDENDRFLVNIKFRNDTPMQQFWFESSEEIKSFFDALQEFIDVSRKTGQPPARKQ